MVEGSGVLVLVGRGSGMEGSAGEGLRLRFERKGVVVGGEGIVVLVFVGGEIGESAGEESRCGWASRAVGERLRLGLKRKGIDIRGGEDGELVVVKGGTVMSPGEGRDMMVTGGHHARSCKCSYRRGGMILVVGLL